MISRTPIPDARSVLRLCLCTLVAVQALLPGLSLAMAPSGPVALAVLCTEHGRVEVLIDLDTGEPVEDIQHTSCGHCLACTGPALASPGVGETRSQAAQSEAMLASGNALPRRAVLPAYAAARGPPSCL